MKKFILTLAALLTMASSTFAQIGSLSSDLVFTPVTPCRIVDTRSAIAGAMKANETRGFWGWNGNYTAQGGSATPCGLPFSSDLAALAVNLLVIAPVGEGWIAAWPFGTTRPLVSNLNFKSGDVLANSAILKISQSGATSDWNLFSTSATHFVADVTGYYSRPVATPLSCVETTPVEATIGLGPTNGVYWVTALAATCAAGYTEVAVKCAVSNALASASPFGGADAGNCGGTSHVSGHLLYASRTCCRVPGK